MSDDLSQTLSDYTEQEQAIIQQIIDEEREKTRAWGSFSVDPRKPGQSGANADSVLIGAAGTLPGIFDAVGDG